MELPIYSSEMASPVLHEVEIASKTKELLESPVVKANGTRKVVMVERVLAHYRIPFFHDLHARLGERGIKLVLIYGQEYRGTEAESATLDETWAQRITNRYFGVPQSHFVWQPCWARLKGADLVIVEQASRLLLNYALLARPHGFHGKLAFWGHGKNLQARWRHRWSERLKRALVPKADWWFVYTDHGANIVSSAGYDKERITITQNAVDTQALALQIEQQDMGEVAALKARLGIRSNRVCVYCGTLYAQKRLDFLLEACEAIRRRVPDFHMLFVGSGPAQGLVEAAAARHPWIHHIGPRFGAERVPYFLMSNAMLMPALVGLGVLDSLTAGLPLLTTAFPGHGPEIAYLQDGVNGVITKASVEHYATAVAEYLESDTLQTRLRGACKASARQYTLDAMVKNFADGIERCLAAR
jgi:L-malate glycosyltransferase